MRYLVPCDVICDAMQCMCDRWGRIGYTACYDQVMYPGDQDVDRAKKLFESMVRDVSTKNNKNYPDSKLDPRIQDIVQLICDIRMMEVSLLDLGYDAYKPFNNLTKYHIQNGYIKLKQISDAIDKGNQTDTFTQLTNDFYTKLPHDFGMRVPPVICDHMMLAEKLTMMEQLENIECAMKLFKRDGANDTVNPLDVRYESLKCNITPLDHDSEQVKLIKKYVFNTHAAASTHTHYSVDVLQVFELEHDGEAKRYEPFQNNENRQLLWYGSRLTNFAGILSQGLRCPPPEAPDRYMFGKGIYFTDMVSKAADYCSTSSRDSNIACMLLYEVALGGMNRQLAGDYHADQLAVGKLSTLGVGKICPDPKHEVRIKDGVVVPCGPGIDSGVAGSALLCNEYIVYDPAQIRMRYLIKMKLN